MKFRIAIPLILFMLSSCGGGGGSSSPEPESAPSDKLVGTWEFRYTDSQCLEINEFGQDGTFRVESLDEIQTGSYTFTSTGTDRYLLTLSFETDNELPSCTGNTTDSSGESMSFFVEFPNSTELYVYEDERGGEVIGIFTLRE